MRITRLELKNFRNIEDLSLKGFAKGINIFAGRNAQGKTNLIEGINYLSWGKSFRGAQDVQLIREKCPSSYIRGDYSCASHGGKVEAVFFRDARRSIRVNGLPIRRTGELLGVMNTVVFAPEDLRVVKGSPSLRRKLLDVELSKLVPSYYRALQEYYQSLKCKNHLLKERKQDVELIRSYGATMVAAAKVIIERRRDFTARLDEVAGAVHASLAGGEGLRLVYRCCCDPENIEESLVNRMAGAESRELETRMSLIGPHREDMDFFIGERNARLYASQGQQRSAMLSVKLAFSDLARELSGERPVLLLDDVFSELDPFRREQLLASVGDSQVFLTTTEEFTAPAGARVFEVREGKVV